MASKATEIRSGIFVILALIVLTILVFSVGNFRSRLEKSVSYTAFLTDAKFLKRHDAVTYGGLRVGEIEGVEVSNERLGTVKVTVKVAQEVQVRADSMLVLKQDGFLGPKYIEISPGTAASELAPPGTVLRGKVPPAITDLTAAMEEPLGKLDRMLDHVNAILGKPENQKNIAESLAETRGLLAGMNETMQKLGTAAGKTAEKTTEVLEEIGQTVKSARQPLTNTLKNTEELTAKLARDLDQLGVKMAKAVDELTARLSKTADSLDLLLRDADSMLVQNNKNVYEMIRSMRETAYHLELAAKRIRANPSIVLFGAEETAEERRKTDETEIRLKGRARRYDKEDPK